MNIIFQIPFKETLYAGRTIYNGYKNAFKDLGHKFKSLTADDNWEKLFYEFKPDLLIIPFNPHFQKFINFKVIKNYKNFGLKVFVNIPLWKLLFKKNRINESPGLASNKYLIDIIKSGDFGDVYYNICEQDDPRMEGFEKITKYKHYTIPLAADKIVLKEKFDENFKADISYVGTYLPQKIEYIRKYVFPLKKKYNLKIYGQDWGHLDRTIGWIQRGGQYFNIPCLRSLRKPKLKLEVEAKIYKSSTICINIHEESQVMFGGDCNERTFKIPFCGGFEITDNVECIKKYFKDGEEIIIGKDEKDWYEKIEYYIKYPEKREKIIKAGKERVLKEHTYHHRVNQMIDIYDKIKK